MEIEMAKSGRVAIIHEVRLGKSENWQLCFQWCRYQYDDGSDEYGYRFIWRRDDGSLQGARGQARIPSIDDLETLVTMAKNDGWGDLKATKEGFTR
jgi:hypothetical protein